MNWSLLRDFVVILARIVGFLGDLGSFVEGIAAVLALVTILYVLKQTREMARQNQLATNAAVATLYRDIASSMQAIDKMFFDNPELKPYFYRNVEVSQENGNHYERAMSLAEMFCDFMDMFLVLERVAPDLPKSPIPWKDWKYYFADFYRTSPAIRRFWAEHSGWYSTALAELLERLPNEYCRVDTGADS